MFKGVDISHHQLPAKIDWPALSAEQDFCVCRAAYGAKTDETFSKHFAAARSAGLTVGAYLFYRQTEGWLRQYEIFVSALQKAKYRAGDLVPAVDLEWNEDYDGKVNPGIFNTEASKLVEKIVEEFGECLVYFSPAFLTLLGSPEWVLSRPMWIANYTHEPKVAWTIWQKSGSGSVAGFAGPIDVNLAKALPPSVRVPWEKSDPVDEDLQQLAKRFDDAVTSLEAGVADLRQAAKLILSKVK